MYEIIQLSLSLSMFDDQVSLLCQPLSLDDQCDGELYVEGLYLKAAQWDNEIGALVLPSQSYYNPMPTVSVRAELSNNMKQVDESTQLYNCPMFSTIVSSLVPVYILFPFHYLVDCLHHSFIISLFTLL